MNEVISKKVDFINRRRDKIEVSVKSMQNSFMTQVVGTALENLDIKDGVIQNTAKNLRIISEMDKIYLKFNDKVQSKLIESFGNDMLKISAFNNTYFAETMRNETTAKRIQSVRTNANNILRARLGVDNSGSMVKGGYLESFLNDRNVINETKNLMLRAVTSGKPLNEFRNEVGKYVKGTGESTGAFERYYRQHAYDVYQESDRTYNDIAAKEFKLNYAIYQGGLIKDTRDMCREYNDKVVTRAEVDEFKNWTPAKAKNIKPEDIKQKDHYAIPTYISDFPGYEGALHCGGFNCRHSLTWIPESTAKRLGVVK